MKNFQTYLANLGWEIVYQPLFRYMLPGYTALALGPLIIYRYGGVREVVRRHEKIHRLQFYESLLAAPLVYLALNFLLPGGIAFILALSSGWLWYVGEFLYHYGRLKNYKWAYKRISWEKEARRGEGSAFYLVERRWFTWIKFI